MTDACCREKLLSNIAQLVSKFVHDVSIKSGLSEKVASEAGGRIYTSGSYRYVSWSGTSVVMLTFLKTRCARSRIRYRYDMRLSSAYLQGAFLWRVSANVERMACSHGDLGQSIPSSARDLRLGLNRG